MSENKTHKVEELTRELELSRQLYAALSRSMGQDESVAGATDEEAKPPPSAAAGKAGSRKVSRNPFQSLSRLGTAGKRSNGRTSLRKASDRESA
eukprot:4672658-Prymnesium_polylepis.1